MPTGDYHDQSTTALTANYVQFRPSTPAKSYTVINDDAAKVVYVSWDGTHIIKKVMPGEVYNRNPGNGYVSAVYLESLAADADYRLEFEPGT